MNIHEKSIIVTGAGRGIGRALARELARQGARVACASRTEDQLRETIRLIENEGGTAIAIPTDVQNRQSVDEMAAQTLRAFEQVDVLINNAGGLGEVGAIWEVDPEVWWSDVTTNLLGPFLCARAVLPDMIRRNHGIIVNLCGGGIDRPFVGASGYGCSKTALTRLTDTLAFELQQARHDIQVYGFDPGLVRTAMTESATASKAADRWIPKMKEWLETGRDHPVEESAIALIKLLSISCPALSGRIFYYHQDFREIARRAEDIQARDTFQIRYLTNF